MENSEQLKSTFHHLEVRSSRPFFKKINDYLILILNSRVLFSIWAIIFFVPSLFWHLGCYIKIIFTKKIKATSPVISVGNLEVGGTGKTPLTIEIGKIFKEVLQKVCIVSYAKSEESLDEPILISKELPGMKVFYGRSRRNALLEAFNSNCDLIILDDGFQYFDIKNKIDIVVIDPLVPTVFLIPAGRMRFPLSFLKYADAIVINKSMVSDYIYKKMLQKFEKYGKPIFEARYEPNCFVDVKGKKYTLNFIYGKKVLLICGIAKPDRFINTVYTLQPACILSAAYPDHFDYSKKDILEIGKIFYREKCDMVVTTKKDLVKLEKFDVDFPLYAIDIIIKIEPYKIFVEWLMNKFYSIRCEKIDL
ncbi:MAG: tetraacyldisaccharide 4'-kinase [Candidatus Omnitrophica bacterium]|nr:tetraacyldisaccharide 4'-kinase [Candidatus Omnitrophota bacterium]